MRIPVEFEVLSREIFAKREVKPLLSVEEVAFECVKAETLKACAKR